MKNVFACGMSASSSGAQRSKITRSTSPRAGVRSGRSRLCLRAFATLPTRASPVLFVMTPDMGPVPVERNRRTTRSWFAITKKNGNGGSTEGQWRSIVSDHMSWLMSAIDDRFMRASERACLGAWRDELLRGLAGEVLEVGAGTGVNLSSILRPSTASCWSSLQLLTCVAISRGGWSARAAKPKCTPPTPRRFRFPTARSTPWSRHCCSARCPTLPPCSTKSGESCPGWCVRLSRARGGRRRLGQATVATPNRALVEAHRG